MVPPQQAKEGTVQAPGLKPKKTAPGSVNPVSSTPSIPPPVPASFVQLPPSITARPGASTSASGGVVHAPSAGNALLKRKKHKLLATATAAGTPAGTSSGVTVPRTGGLDGIAHSVVKGGLLHPPPMPPSFAIADALAEYRKLIAEPMVGRGPAVKELYRRLADEFNPYLVGWWYECMGRIGERRWRSQGLKESPRRVVRGLGWRKSRVRVGVGSVVGFDEGAGEEDEEEEKRLDAFVGQSRKNIASASAVDEGASATEEGDTWDLNAPPRGLAPSSSATKAPVTNHSFSYRTPWYQYPPSETAQASSDCPLVENVAAEKKVELVDNIADEDADASARMAQAHISGENTSDIGRSKMDDQDLEEAIEIGIEGRLILRQSSKDPLSQITWSGAATSEQEATAFPARSSHSSPKLPDMYAENDPPPSPTSIAVSEGTSNGTHKNVSSDVEGYTVIDRISNNTSPGTSHLPNWVHIPTLTTLSTPPAMPLRLPPQNNSPPSSPDQAQHSRPINHSTKVDLPTEQAHRERPTAATRSTMSSAVERNNTMTSSSTSSSHSSDGTPASPRIRALAKYWWAKIRERACEQSDAAAIQAAIAAIPDAESEIPQRVYTARSTCPASPGAEARAPISGGVAGEGWGGGGPGALGARGRNLNGFPRPHGVFEGEEYEAYINPPLPPLNVIVPGPYDTRLPPSLMPHPYRLGDNPLTCPDLADVAKTHRGSVRGSVKGVRSVRESVKGVRCEDRDRWAHDDGGDGNGKGKEDNDKKKDRVSKEWRDYRGVKWRRSDRELAN